MPGNLTLEDYREALKQYGDWITEAERRGWGDALVADRDGRTLMTVPELLHKLAWRKFDGLAAENLAPRKED